MEKLVGRLGDFNILPSEADRLSWPKYKNKNKTTQKIQKQKNPLKIYKKIYCTNKKHDLMYTYRTLQPISIEYNLFGSIYDAFIKLP